MNRLKSIILLSVATIFAILLTVIHSKNVTINALNSQANELNNVIIEKDTENERLRQEFDNLKDSRCEFKYLGTYKITYYCDERTDHICGGTGVTASGVPTDVGTTIAVDPKIIPYGTEVYIEGVGHRIAQDCGGAVKDKHIDVLVQTHAEAMRLGTTYRDVWVIVQN